MMDKEDILKADNECLLIEDTITEEAYLKLLVFGLKFGSSKEECMRP